MYGCKFIQVHYNDDLLVSAEEIIYALDELDDGIHVNPVLKKVQRELFDCINNPIKMLKAVIADQQFTIDTDMIVNLSNGYIAAQYLFDNLTLENFGQSNIVGYYCDEVCGNDRYFSKDAFSGII